MRARNVEQEIKILQLFELILQLHAEVGRRRAPVVEGEEEAGESVGAPGADYSEVPDQTPIHPVTQDAGSVLELEVLQASARPYSELNT